VYGSNHHRLERQTSLPFARQWAFEWRQLADATNAPKQNFPHYFVDSTQQQSGVSIQVSQRQADVYLSAYLRTFACAVDQWGMPVERALSYAIDALPINKGLSLLAPISRPEWLEDMPEKCATALDAMEPLIREVLSRARRVTGTEPITLKIPISNDAAEFGELSIQALIASSDFRPNFASETLPYERSLRMFLRDGLSIEGDLPSAGISDYVSPGATGSAAPFSLELWPDPCGFWHSDYFSAGISVPAPYAVPNPVKIKCERDSIIFSSTSGQVGTWRVWHDHWTPEYPKGGRTRCGVLTTMDPCLLPYATNRYALALGWLVQLNVWTREKDDGELEYARRREFFFD